MTEPKLTAYRVTQSLYDEGVVFDGLHVDVACEIADGIIDEVIATLRRDPRFAAVSLTELELILADARRGAGFDIANNIEELVPTSDVRDLAKRGFPIGLDVEGAQ